MRKRLREGLAMPLPMLPRHSNDLEITLPMQQSRFEVLFMATPMLPRYSKDLVALVPIPTCHRKEFFGPLPMPTGI
jgi:hypothetical protein